MCFLTAAVVSRDPGALLAPLVWWCRGSRPMLVWALLSTVSSTFLCCRVSCSASCCPRHSTSLYRSPSSSYLTLTTISTSIRLLLSASQVRHMAHSSNTTTTAPTHPPTIRIIVNIPIILWFSEKAVAQVQTSNYSVIVFGEYIWELTT